MKNFTEVLRENVPPVKQSSSEKSQEKSPEKLLRAANIKIKLIIPTKFGTQIDLIRDYDEKEIKSILKGFDIKVKGKSVFVL